MRSQHGDLVLEKVLVIPNGAKKLKIKKGFVVEKGEGIHTHILNDIDGVTVYEHEGTLFLNVSKKVDLLNHEEHGIMTFEPGIYRKGIELEYDAETDEARQTLD